MSERATGPLSPSGPGVQNQGEAAASDKPRTDVKALQEERKRALLAGAPTQGGELIQRMQQRSIRLNKSEQSTSDLAVAAASLSDALSSTSHSSALKSSSSCSSLVPSSPSSPSAALEPVTVTAENRGSHIIYRIVVSRPGQPTLVAKERYSSLLALHTALAARNPAGAALSFPPKTLFKKSSDTIANRVKDFAAYFRDVAAMPECMQYWITTNVFSLL
eukprot:m.67082 g.67082  ORF g.67082 m.67082 type:complete len:219 (-) comp12684_c0_seq3:63-719(-)